MVIDFSTFYDFPSQFDKLFEEFARPFSISQKRMAYPPLNISQDDGAIYVAAEIPGIPMDAIELTLSDKSLVIKGERKPAQGKYYRQERPTGAFQRIINLSVPVNRDKVKATLTDGMLDIVLPKADEVKPQTIAIEPS